MAKVKVVHCINQFFAGISKDDFQPELRLGEPVGSGIDFKSHFGNDAEIIATIICGDKYFAEHTNEVLEQVSRWVKELNPDVFMAGPAFSGGLYGTFCGELCATIQENVAIPAITGMHDANPGVKICKEHGVYVIFTKSSAVGMGEAINAMAPKVIELGKFGATISSEKINDFKDNKEKRDTQSQNNHGMFWGWFNREEHNTKTDQKVDAEKSTQPTQKSTTKFKSALVLKKTNFKSALDKIKKFSDSSTVLIEFDPKEAESKWVFWEHDLTCDQFNEFLTDELIPAFSHVLDTQKKTINEFQNVYKTFDSLDREYIKGIVTAVQSAEEASYQAVEASNQAKDASDEALRASSKVERAQQDICKTVEALGKTVDKLCKFEQELGDFKVKIEKHEHLYDVDKLWDNVNDLCTEQHKLKDSVNNMTQKLKVAYTLAGTAVGISILHIILKLAGVL